MVSRERAVLQAKNLQLSDNAEIMLGIMTDMVHMDGKDNTNFDVLGTVLQKHLQVPAKEAETLTKLFYDVFCIERRN